MYCGCIVASPESIIVLVTIILIIIISSILLSLLLLLLLLLILLLSLFYYYYYHYYYYRCSGAAWSIKKGRKQHLLKSIAKLTLHLKTGHNCGPICVISIWTTSKSITECQIAALETFFVCIIELLFHGEEKTAIDGRNRGVLAYFARRR